MLEIAIPRLSERLGARFVTIAREISLFIAKLSPVRPRYVATANTMAHQNSGAVYRVADAEKGGEAA